MQVLRCLMCALAVIFVAACGGGGGGGDAAPPPPPPSTSGAFTLTSTTASFRAPQNGAQPVGVGIGMTLTGTNIAAVGAAFPQGQQPTWLLVNITGAAPNYTVALAPTPTSTTLAIGQYSAVVLVGTADSSGNVLQSREIQVSYDVFDGIRLTAGAPPSFVFGGATSGTASLNVTANGRSWTLSSNAPWASVPTGTQQGSSTVNIAIDASTLAPGTHKATITAQNPADAIDVRTVDVSAVVSAPTLTVTPNPILLGGANGLDQFSANAALTLNTGPNAYSWTAQLSGGFAGALESSAPGGLVSGTLPGTLPVNLVPENARPGNFAANARFSVTVKGQVFVTDVPVNIKLEEQRLVPQYDGIAFSGFPTAPGLKVRQVRIGHSHGRAGVPWTAQSTSPRVQVSPTSGVTGDVLTISADTNGLAPEILHSVDVQLTTTDPLIQRDERIRVSVWMGASDPTDVAAVLPSVPRAVVTNPVEPWVYVLATDGTLRTFNVHTGNLVTPPYATGATSVGAMAISSDGTKLFVTDTGATPRTIVLNAWSLAQSIAAVYPTVAASTVTDNRFGVVFSRPNGHPMLWSAFDSLSSFEPPVDVETSQRLDVFASGLKLTTGPGGSSPSLDPGRRASPDGRYFYAWSLTSLIRVQFHRFSMLGGPRLELDPGTRYDFFNIVGGVSDYCVDPTNRVHVLRDGDVSVQQFDFGGELDTVDLPLTDPGYVIHCGWNGRVYVGRPSGASEHNVVVLDESGAVVSTYRHGPAAHLFVGYQLALSGDETRLVWPGISTGGTAVLAISSVP